jgi:general stress protein 26
MTNTPEDSTSVGSAPDLTPVPLLWDELRDAVQAAGEGMFLATVGHDGRPHVAFVSPGWHDERLWISSFAGSQKATNLRHRPEVALTCNATPEVNVLVRATARLVDDRAELAQRWAEGVLPYDPGDFFSGPDDPQALFVELIPTYASIHTLWPSPSRRWRPVGHIN